MSNLVSSNGYTYTYTFKHQNQSSTEWRCSIHIKILTCPVTVKQRGDLINNVQYSLQIRQKAKEDVFEPAPTIVDQLIEEHADTLESEAATPISTPI